MEDGNGPRLPRKKQECVTKEDSTEIFGPVLPADFVKDEKGVIGPSMPLPSTDADVSHSVETATSIGPKLPPHPQTMKDDKSEEDENDLFGPALPPKLVQSDERLLGPQLPPGFKPQVSDEEEDDEIIGPLPPSLDDLEKNKESIARAFDMRAKRMKDKLEGKLEPKKLEREEWMTELPPVLQGNFGLGPRQFRAKPVEVGDRSGWTDTPGEERRKKKSSKNDSAGKKIDAYVVERDNSIAEQMKNYQETDKNESLMAMHEKKRKRKLKEDEESGAANIRRPFDRDIDLQANRFDQAAKKRMLKQSAGLDSRFSHGETSGTFL